MVIFKRLVTAVLLFALAIAVPLGAQAGGQCAIHLRFSYGGVPVSGGAVTLYKVSDENGLSTGFEEYEGGTEVSPEDAKALSRYAVASSVPGDTRNTDNAGVISYTGLLPGLYLLVQEKAACGFEPMSPFLVSLPMAVGGESLNDVFASPKMAVSVQCDIVPDVPRTGDEHAPGLWLGCAAVSAFLLFGAASYRKTRKWAQK